MTLPRSESDIGGGGGRVAGSVTVRWFLRSASYLNPFNGVWTAETTHQISKTTFRSDRIGGSQGLSQSRLAKLLGVHATTIRAWELGRRLPPDGRLREVSVLLEQRPGGQAE
ncbi:MAG: helix-turn-helix transcriptional regulator [bacterium]|nr:helix-turn-helix transcriptional regulator [bacterium]